MGVTFISMIGGPDLETSGRPMNPLGLPFLRRIARHCVLLSGCGVGEKQAVAQAISADETRRRQLPLAFLSVRSACLSLRSPLPPALVPEGFLRRM